MNLYVWNNPYRVRYGCSFVVAVAETEAAARKEAAKGMAYTYGEFEREGVQGLALGAPLLVVPCPCAEWHEWSE